MIGRTILTVARKETGILDIGGKRCKNSLDIPLELMQGNIIFKVKKKKKPQNSKYSENIFQI